MAQLVQLVDVLTFVEMIVEPQHITVKAGKEHLAVPFPVYPDFGNGGLQRLCRHGEMYRCPDVYKRQALFLIHNVASCRSVVGRWFPQLAIFPVRYCPPYGFPPE